MKGDSLVGEVRGGWEEFPVWGNRIKKKESLRQKDHSILAEQKKGQIGLKFGEQKEVLFDKNQAKARSASP